jgi:tRNA pseudouridine55 synthase
MENIINVYKPIGLTPMQTINLFKEKYTSFKNKSISHAGRLDPLAEGVIPLVFDKTTTKLRKYLNQNKEYITKILIGFSTDSYDILGLAKKYNNIYEIDNNKLNDIISSFKGKIVQVIPIYSSKKIRGKELFKYAREGKKINPPKKKINIFDINLLSVEKLSNHELNKQIIDKISLLNGDFRQKEIISRWKGLLTEIEEYYVIELLIKCSSGTYIRSIAEDIGKKLSTGACILNLIRTKVGNLNIKNSIRIN